MTDKQQEVKRYRFGHSMQPNHQAADPSPISVGGAYQVKDGEWVRYSDYAALAAEAQRLRKALQHILTVCEQVDPDDVWASIDEIWETARFPQQERT